MPRTVSKCMAKLHANKLPDIDNNSPGLLFEISDEFSVPSTIIIRKSLSSGVIDVQLL